MISNSEKQNEIFVVKWNDNKCVTVATNVDTVEPLAIVSRWRKEKKDDICEPESRLIHNYNFF